MISSKYKILLILLSEEKVNFLRQILSIQNYLILEATSGEAGIQKAIEQNPDLIICQNELENYNGFQIYNQLKNQLIKRGTPFFIYSDAFDQEDILIGLEMGIDNFIISPVEEEVLLNKVEHQINKIRELKHFETEKFEDYFNSTPVAKFIFKNNRIELANAAFYKLMQFEKAEIEFPLISEIFDLSENKKNAINYRKFVSGLYQHCNLKRVPGLIEGNGIYDIHLYFEGLGFKGKLFAEVIPSIVDRYMGNSVEKYNKLENIPEAIKLNLKKGNCIVNLTPRESQILELSSLGLPIKQIAGNLEISQRTIEKHRANIMQKTKTNSIIEAIYVLRNNISPSEILHVV